uniref:Beta/gamma crystallin 'Greek key' domain-containing protein n=1 Tax=Ascaris lumbricoides TaxID=6252 RepID=A0A0M3ITE6_ASCLU
MRRGITFVGGLAIIENESERSFISGYLETEIDATRANDDGLGVWIAGRSIANFSEAVYVWMPQHYLIQNNFWEQGQPLIYSNLTGMQLMNVQCLCVNGYRGEFCDIQPERNGTRSESQSVACNSQPFEFACSSGATIQVDFAAYGYINVSLETFC